MCASTNPLAGSEVDEEPNKCSLLSPSYPIGFAISMILALNFFLSGSITFFIGFAEHRRAKMSNPEVFNPPNVIVLLHCFFVLLTTSFFIVVAIAFHKKNVSCLFWRGLIPSLFTLLCFCYIYYLILYFTSDEFQSGSSSRTFEQWETYKTQIITSEPFEEYMASGEHGSSRCRITEPLRIYASISTDSSVLPKLKPHGLYRIITDVFVNWTYDSIIPLVLTEYTLKGCIPEKSALERKDWVFERQTKFDGFIKSQFVSETENLPPKLSRTHGIVAGIFWSGVMYAYRIDSVPITRITVTKIDAIMDVAHEDCTSINWDCNC